MAEIEGLRELNRQLESLKGIKTSKALLKGALTLQKWSMFNAPVKTGFLRQSHESVEVEGGAEMRVEAVYSWFVEMGTRFFAGKPYVRPAISQHSEDVVKAVGSEIEKEMKGKVGGGL